MKDGKRCILLLSDSFIGYGAEHILRWLGNKLCENGNKVVFCSIFDSDRPQGLSEGAYSYQMGFDWWKYDVHYFFAGARFLRKICKSENVDYVITFHTNPFLLALIARLFSSFKILHSERDNPYVRDTIATKFKMRLYRYADKVVFQTEGAKLFFDKKTQRKSTIIPNPVEIPGMQWLNLSSAKTLVSVGRLDIRFKRQDLLLNAFSIIIKDFPGYRLRFYGDGIHRKQLEEQAVELGVSDKVDFLGKVSGVTAHLINEGVFVMTSDSEGMPNSLMEAMALGMPVISTDCEPGGARALIDDGVNGYITERSSVEDLVRVLRIVLADEKLQEAIGREARRKMHQYSPGQVFQMWINYIEK